MSETVDFDLGGVVGVRLVDAGPADRGAVARQLGPIEKPLAREPDLVLRFVERLAGTGTRRFVGLDDAAFDEQAFLLLRGKHKSRAAVEVPFERLGGRCELLCERGMAAVPLLVPMINFTALAKGVLPLHAAAFVHRGRGVLATGWSKGGKTETLLAFLSRGARYVGDEWTYLTRDGRGMFGIPEPIRVWSWHLDSLPELRTHLSAGERARLSMLGFMTGGMGRMTDGGARHASAATRSMNRFSALLRGQMCVDLPPERLFPGSLSTTNGSDTAPAVPEVLLFVMSCDAPEIRVEPIAPEIVAARMRASLAEEDLRLASCYHKFRFAFPERSNPLFERAAEMRAELLTSALSGKRAFEVRHPYPVSLPALYEALEGVVA